MYIIIIEERISHRAIFFIYIYIWTSDYNVSSYNVVSMVSTAIVIHLYMLFDKYMYHVHIYAHISDKLGI